MHVAINDIENKIKKLRFQEFSLKKGPFTKYLFC